jgi:hypothetical protein
MTRHIAPYTGKGKTMTISEVHELIHKPDKSRAEWLALYRAELADYDDGDDGFILNEIGLAGGWEKYVRETEQVRQDGIGVL